MKLGLDIYSLRFQGWNAFEHLDYAARIGLDVVHFSDLEPFERLDDDYLRQLKARADALGLLIEVGMGSICPTSSAFHANEGSAVEQVRRMLHVAELLGSPVLRCLLGGIRERFSATPLREHIAGLVAVCRAVRQPCLDLGIKLAIENHAGDLQGRELRAIIEQAGPEYVGACIDPGNAVWAMEDPLSNLEYLAPYVVTSHGRDSHVMAHPRGATFQWAPFGAGNVGIDRWVTRFRELCPAVPLTLEIITGRPPTVLPYFEDAHWAGYRDMPAWELARFEALVREGRPYLLPMVTVAAGDVTPEFHDALTAQQRLDVERSVRYCRETLGI